MTQPTHLPPQTTDWAKAETTQEVISALHAAKPDCVRFVGGCVRNALMGRPVDDVDLATQLEPEAVLEALKTAKIRAVPTGLAHGTITAIAGGKPFEITSLRKDVKTDGRHATVSYTTDWHEDSERRDFRFNAIYADPADGSLYDPQDGIKDALSGHVAFVGDPDTRIAEDYLRILRFFRFFAWYGEVRPDRESVKACARQREGMKNLSAERVWKELKKLLLAPDPSKSLRWMRTAEVLQVILPESIHVDRACAFIALEKEMGWEPDPLLRLMAMVDSRRWSKISTHLKLSNVEKNRLKAWYDAGEVDPNEDYMDVSRRFYRKIVSGYVDAAKIAMGTLFDRDRRNVQDLMEFADEWERPVFPVSAKDLMKEGYKEGRELGDLLWDMEDEWINSGFALSTSELIAKIGNFGTGGKSGGQG
jgi:tRNA nucleotidyltransferase/poly(A) polymerase